MDNVLHTLEWFHVMNLKGNHFAINVPIATRPSSVVFFVTGSTFADAVEKALNPFIDLYDESKYLNVSSWNINWTEIYVSVAPQMEDTIFEVYLLNVVVNNNIDLSLFG